MQCLKLLGCLGNDDVAEAHAECGEGKERRSAKAQDDVEGKKQEGHRGLPGVDLLPIQG